MTPLGDTYKKNGFTYELVTREGDIAIFQQRLRPGVGCLAYEVIIVQKDPDRTIAGAFIPAHERAPGNEEFGRKGWSMPTLQRARAKMAELVAAQESGNESTPKCGRKGKGGTE
jgi:hypothetical protein